MNKVYLSGTMSRKDRKTDASLDGLKPRRNQPRRLDDYQDVSERHKKDDKGKKGLKASDINKFDQELKNIEPDKTKKLSRKERRKLKKSQRSPAKKRAIKIAKISLAVVVVIGIIIGIKSFIALQNIIERNLNGGALALQDNIDPNQLKGEGDGRVNILVIGIGGNGHQGGQLSDVILVASIDPINNEVAFLSIPRDLYLSIPGYYSTKINAAHALGEQSGAKGGGPEVLKKAVEDVLGVEMHYYVRVDFKGFIKAVDSVGGITVNVKERIYDPFIESSYGGGYRRAFIVEPGKQTMSGKKALQYARSRKTTSDFDRARRQQEIIVALKSKVLSLGTFSNPVKISNLIDAAGSHVRTNLQIAEMLKLLEIADRISNKKTKHAVLDNSPDNYLISQSINGASTLIPKAGLDNFTEIQRYVRGKLFVDGFIKSELAQISVLNGTTTPGLAKKVSDKLKGLGYNVKEVADAPSSDNVQTVIYDQTNGLKPYTKRLLEKRFKTTTKQGLPSSLASTSDFVIVLGTDYSVSNE